MSVPARNAASASEIPKNAPSAAVAERERDDAQREQLPPAERGEDLEQAGHDPAADRGSRGR